VRLGLLLLVLAMGTAVAQEAPKKKIKAAPKKTGKTELKAHQKPTPEQIRKFNELQKKK
jgi:hypothetical protein